MKSTGLDRNEPAPIEPVIVGLTPRQLRFVKKLAWAARPFVLAAAVGMSVVGVPLARLGVWEVTYPRMASKPVKE